MGLRTLFRRRDVDADLADEVAHFMEEAEATMIARGATPEEARRAVRMRYGEPLNAREDVRTSGWEAAVDGLLSDLRLSVRSLRRSPAFTTVVALTLGLGIGATTAIVSAVRPVLFEPLAYPAADRLVALADRGEDGSPIPMTFGTYRELSERARVFASLAVLKPWAPTLTQDGTPARLEGQSVSASYFDVLGVAPALGPGLDPTQDRPGGALQVVISDGLWRERFAADPGVVGRIVHLDGFPTTVVGVMPADFENVTAPLARLWTLLQYDARLPGFDTREWGHHLEAVGRLIPGVPIDEAASALDRIAAEPVEEMPRPEWASMARGLDQRPLKDAVTADVKPTMLVLLGAVALLIVITCANLTILLLARGSRRRAEFAMRRALGAARPRLARYLVTEGLLLALIGGAIGVSVAHLGLAGLMAVAPPSLPRIGSVEVDGPALLLALAVTTVVGLVFGLAPGLHRGAVTSSALHDTARGAVPGSRATRKGLVVAEVALATVLLIGAGLSLRSAERLFSQPLGTEPSGAVVMQVFGTGLESGDRVTHRFFDQALDAVRSVPGVTSVTMTSQLPLSGQTDRYGARPDDGDAVEGELGPVERYAVAPGFFETMGIGLERGRAFDARDIEGAPRAAILSRSLADRLYPGGEALGRSVRVGDVRLEPFTIVGVAQDVKHVSLADGPSSGVYVPTHQWHWADRVRWFVFRSEGDATALVAPVRQAIWSVDAGQPIVRAQAMDELVLRSEARRRFVMIILSAFAFSALTICGIGLFGVLSGIVAERGREMGVRAALGASRERIVRIVVAQGLGMTAVGVVIGVATAAGIGDVLSPMLFEVSPLDPTTYLAVIALLAAGATLSSAIPAIRAGQVDPAAALRSE